MQRVVDVEEKLVGRPFWKEIACDQITITDSLAKI